MSLASGALAEAAIGAGAGAAPKKTGPTPKPRTMVAKADGRLAPEIR